MAETYIFRMTHHQNLDALLTYGIHCPNSQNKIANYINIGDAGLISNRAMVTIPVTPNGVLHDYIPFYFCPRSPMLYKINKNPHIYKTLESDIIYLVSSVERVENAGIPYVFTDGHAYIKISKFFNQKNDLSNLFWNEINSPFWNDTPTEPDRSRRKQAEFLVYQQLPINCLVHIAVYDQNILNKIQGILQKNGITLNTSIERSWYY